MKCLPLAALAILGAQLPTLYLLSAGRGLNTSLLVTMREPGYQGVYFVSALLSLVLNATILLRQYKLSTGSQPGGEVATMARRVLALLVLTLLFVFTFLVCLAPAALLLTGVPKGLVAVLCLMLISYVFVSLSCAYAVLILERVGPMTSLRRSWSLTRGSFWRLTAVYTVALIILIVFYVVLGTATGFVVALVAHGELAVMTAVYAVVAVALGTFVVPFYSAVQLAVFGDLSARREGADLAQRISATA
ncbi:MAG TPA: hypothetical protein VGI91_05065 [Steroidobacteraceae bacterium]